MDSALCGWGELEKSKQKIDSAVYRLRELEKRRNKQTSFSLSYLGATMQSGGDDLCRF